MIRLAQPAQTLVEPVPGERPYLYGTAGAECAHYLPPPPSRRKSAPRVERIVFGGRSFLAVFQRDQVWQSENSGAVAPWQLVCRLDDDDFTVRTVVLVGPNTVVATTAHDTGICIYDIALRQLLRRHKFATHCVQLLAASPWTTDRFVCVLSNQLQLLDLDRAVHASSPRYQLPTSDNNVFVVAAVNECGSVVACATFYGDMFLFDAGLQPLCHIPSESYMVSALAVSPCGRHLVVAEHSPRGSMSFIHVYDLSRISSSTTTTGTTTTSRSNLRLCGFPVPVPESVRKGIVSSISLLGSGGSRVACTLFDGTIRVFDLALCGTENSRAVTPVVDGMIALNRATQQQAVVAFGTTSKYTTQMNEFAIE